MMESFKNLFENLKERLKTAWAEQMESEFVIRLRERFDELPSLGQKAIIAGSAILVVMLFLWWPLSNMMDASDFNATFDNHRELLKELQQVQRDITSGPNPPITMPPSAYKTQFDQKLSSQGVKPDQVKESLAVPDRVVSGVQERGFSYKLQKLTVRQAVDLAYELEPTDPALKILDLKIQNTDPDPHFYDVSFKLVTYAPVIAEIPGGGLLDSLKNKNGSAGFGGVVPGAGGAAGANAPSPSGGAMPSGVAPTGNL